MGTYAKLEQWKRRVEDLPRVEGLRRVLLGDPGAFQVAEAINVHMRDASGRLQRIDPSAARQEWEALAAAYRALGVEVHVLPARPELPDLCFTANPSLALPLPEKGEEIWLARMAHPSRAGEVPLHEAFFRERGLPIRTMPPQVPRFEGCGDGVLHPRRFLIHAGVGPRSDARAWEALAAAHPELEILLYRLEDPRFYHLDTALAPLDEKTALYVPEAFDRAGRALLRAAFEDAIPLSIEEALRFAANAHCPDGEHVLIQADCPQATAALRARGFLPIPLETAEFRKSGGSVFCLKMAF